jgi:hypothetical protein
MKNPKIEKSKFPFITEAREYLSNSMLINQSYIKPDVTAKEVVIDRAVNKSIQNKPFNHLEHILEG